MRHQRGANQKTVGEMAEFAHLAVGINAGLADDGHAVAQSRRQLAGAIEVNRQVAQIAVVNAHDFCAKRNGTFQLFFVADLGQHTHFQAVCHGGKLTILFVIQHG
ncbi:hypothetical protein D3C81_1932070 [compost metagenome]